MTRSPVRTIAQRELNETLTDWRILLPIFILTFVLPTLLISATNFAINFIGDPEVIPRLVPFIMLVIGFIPASFSLITALESFVGERERNSLEALLSMPISDSQLYLGKLLSSLLPPLLSSYLAMSVFGVLLATRFPNLFAQGLSFELLVIVVLLITLKAVVMVAGAVIISSHTTSIRAANLLASFILLPTASVIQAEAVLFIGRTSFSIRLLWGVAALLVLIALVLIRTGMKTFNREEILSREHEQLNLRHIGATFRLFLREYQPAGVAPSQYRNAPFDVQRFYRAELPSLLRDYRVPLLVAAAAALLGLVVGVARISGGFENALRSLDTVPQAGLRLVLASFGDNLRATLLMGILALPTFGILPFLVAAGAFARIGTVAALLAARGGEWFTLGDNSPLHYLVARVLPHGIVELPTLLLCAALGLRLGVSLFSPPRGFSVGQNIMWSLAQWCKVWALVVLPLMLLASLIEGLITPLIIAALR